MNNIFKDIPCSNAFEKAKKIAKGMSGEDKYLIETKQHERFLLRICDIENYNRKKKEYEYLFKICDASLPVPTPKSFGICNNGKSTYTLLSWIDGEDAEKVLPSLPFEKQYDLGIQAGHILKQIHDTSVVSNIENTWYERYFEIINPRLEAYKNEGIRFEGSERILSFLEDNKQLLIGRPQCNHHGDYHIGNLIINNGKLFVIDWHTVDFENIGDPWYEFNRVGIECPAFASGQIDGYFNNNVPNEFWKIFALYYATSAITSIAWIKYYAPNQLDYIMNMNKNALSWIEKNECPIPKWYKKN